MTRGLDQAPIYLCFQTHSFMSLTSTDIARIARLARLELSPAHSERMLGQLNSFLTSWNRCARWTPQAWNPWPIR